MKLFTLKDFILYNGPCFNCGNAVKVDMKFAINNSIYNFSSQNINKGILEVVLNIKYVKALKLFINTKSNKFEVTDYNYFLEFLEDRDLLLYSTCFKCMNMIISNNLEFSNNGYLKPITIRRELLTVQDGHNLYDLLTDFSLNETSLMVSRDDKISNMEIKLPLLPIYKFKTKDNLLKKLRTYVLLS